MTKNPLSQHVDVLIPKSTQIAEPKQLELFKNLFGKKYTPTQLHESRTTKNIERLSTPNTTHDTKNACVFESSVTKPIKEFIHTEQSYVNLLEEIVYKIMRPIRESIVDPDKTPILDQYSLNRIFINMEDILTVNKAFLTSLKKYENGDSIKTFGQILVEHMNKFDCYRIFFLGKSNSLACHTQNIKQNKNYSKFLINKEFKGNLGMSDVLIQPIQRMTRYNLLLQVIMNAMDVNDPDIINLREANSKVSKINDMQYGDSSLLNLYHFIRDAPASLIQSRQLLGYYDATELSLLSGKSTRPVTILIFSDKIMVVKRKNYNLQGKDYLDKIEEKVKNTASSSMLQKAKEVYNGLPFEFKGWADIRAIEFFNGLKDRPDTFFIRSCLPELPPNATEKECEDYFRRSDRLYSIIPNTNKFRSLSIYLEKKQELIKLGQKQCAVAKLKDVDHDLYIEEDKLKYPAYTHMYDENSYNLATFKNHILMVYVDDNCPKHKIQLNQLVSDDVWIIILLNHQQAMGYKATIRAKTNLIPIRDISREIEFETIVHHQTLKNNNQPLDFIDTLWNNLFFYERRLRATEAFSLISDDLLRVRARSRSRSKSLTRVASNMSIGKLFSRSRSSSLSRSFPSERYDDDVLDQAIMAQQVQDAIFKVATVHKDIPDSTSVTLNARHRASPSSITQIQPVNSTSDSYLKHRRSSKPPNIYTQHHSSTEASNRMSVNKDLRGECDYMYPAKEGNTVRVHPHDGYEGYEINQIHHDTSDKRPYLYRRDSSHFNTQNKNLDYLPSYHPTEPCLPPRPSSGGSNTSSSASTSDMSSSADYSAYFSRSSTSLNDSSISSYPYNSLSSLNSSTYRSYFDDKYSSREFLPSPSTDRYGSTSSLESMQFIDRQQQQQMRPIDSPRRFSHGGMRRPPLHPEFYTQPPAQNHSTTTPPPLQFHPQGSVSTPFQSYSSRISHRKNSIPPDLVQLKTDVNNLIDDLIQSQQQLKIDDMSNYYNSTYENVRGLRSHIVSKLDQFMDGLPHDNQQRNENH
ncbi:hypothetical protein BDF20DRAFT_833040 [Mycotypha africana]|uniref:uncharacterized protein n=1 Tax=Mycotypha africana TaxID=64632 RepID=UPI0023015548|nr:uncharacterized protein BDF20DRAFT_833040 [Mycotypha africana]KAI8988166.1 hypothetical protein BDF20DRAFT_833040 [Mycotypha africana]